MNSASEANPWLIRAPGRRPPPGPERDAWLDAQVLFRHHQDIEGLLDDIAPEIRQNLPAALETDAVSHKILQFIQDKLDAKLPPTAALVLLGFLNRGFKQYCRTHHLERIHFPLLQDLSLEEGLLDGDTMAAATLHRRLVDSWWAHAFGLLSSGTATPRQIAGALVVSAALFGGLARQDHWSELVAHLQEALTNHGRLIRLELAGGYCWVADPISETLIRRWTAVGLLPLPADSVTPAAWRAEIGAYVPDDHGRETDHPQRADALLANAARGMLLQHFAPDIAAIALGTLANTPLPRAAWLRLVGESVPHTPATAPQVEIPPAHRSSPDTRIIDPVIWQQIFDLENSLRWEPAEYRKAGLTLASGSSSVREQYVERAMPGIATARRHIDAHYIRRGLDGSACYSRTLCQFAEDLINLGGLIRERLAPATIWSYFQDVRHALDKFGVSDMRHFSASARQDAYRQAMDEVKPGSRGGLSSALHLFDRTLIRSLDIDDEMDWMLVSHFTRTEGQVDANLVDPRCYQALWKALEEIQCDGHLRLLWMVLATLLYRFGLRRGEVHELTLADIEFQSDHQIVLTIPISRLTTNKSRQARRTIGPVIVSPQEWARLRELTDQRYKEFRHRLNLAEVYLFGRPGYGSQLLTDSLLFSPLTELLHWVSGDDSLRIHHFRHGFASRFFAAERTDLASMDEAASRPGQWRHAFRTDGAWLRAFELGHVNPAESVLNYCHTADLVHHHYACRAVAALLPLGILSRLVGLADRSLERTAHRRAQKGNLSISPNVALLLETARHRWALEPEPVSPSVCNDCADSRPSPSVTSAASIPPAGRERPPRFEDMLAITRDHLRNRLDLSAWERTGYRSTDIRRWLLVIDHLTALGLQRSDRQRRDRMPADLIRCGQRMLEAVSDENIGSYRRVLTRCLVGLGQSKRSMRVDMATAGKLKAWIEASNPGELNVVVEDIGDGMPSVSLMGADRIAPSIQALFCSLLGTCLLDLDDLEDQVLPFLNLRRQSVSRRG